MNEHYQLTRRNGVRLKSLLTVSNAKIVKSLDKGYLTVGLHLAPTTLSGYNVCAKASPGCAAACLNTSGRGVFTTVQSARVAKTRLLFNDRRQFMARLFEDLFVEVASAERSGLKLAARLNLTSDLPWEHIHVPTTGDRCIMNAFPDIQFYDYTADIRRMTRYLGGELPENYKLTFSRKENTPDSVIDAVLQSGGNVAVVFDKVPDTWHGVQVVDGDVDDLRFLDPAPCIVGLKQKGRAKKDDSGFVVRVA